MNTLKKIAKLTYNKIKPRNYKIQETYEIIPTISKQKTQRLNLCITSMNDQDVYAGIRSAIDFFLGFSKNDDNLKFRIIVMGRRIDPKKLFSIENFKRVNNQIDSEEKFQIVDITEGKHELFVSESDVFISTMWYTAFNIQPVIQWQKNQFYKNYNLIYLIQDFEPGFYPWSSRYLLAESTYHFENIIAVFNSKSLYDYFIDKGFNFKKTYYFRPTLNRNLKKKLLENQNLKRKNRILFYGRPSKKRNSYELILMIFNELVKNYPSLVTDWEIISIGEDTKEVFLDNGYKIKSMGKMTIEDYADLMKSSKIGISLMASPHPSYPPLEMATFGMKVITNSFETKNLSDFNSNIISIDNMSPKDISVIIASYIQYGDIGTIDLKSNYVNGNRDLDEIIGKIGKEMFNC